MDAGEVAGWFGAKLRELRESRLLTRKELAERSKLSAAGIADLEQGRRKPTRETVVALAEALSVGVIVFTEPPLGGSAEKPGRGRPRKNPPPASQE